MAIDGVTVAQESPHHAKGSHWTGILRDPPGCSSILKKMDGETNFLISESHLAAGVAGDVHPAEEEATVISAADAAAPDAHGASHFALNATVILFIDDVVHTVAVDQQILLQ